MSDDNKKAEQATSDRKRLDDLDRRITDKENELTSHKKVEGFADDYKHDLDKTDIGHDYEPDDDDLEAEDER